MPRFGRPPRQRTNQQAPRDMPAGRRRTTRAARGALSGRRFEAKPGTMGEVASRLKLGTPRRLTLAGTGVGLLALLVAAGAAGGDEPSTPIPATPADEATSAPPANEVPGGSHATAATAAQEAAPTATPAPPTPTATRVPPTPTPVPPTATTAPTRAPTVAPARTSCNPNYAGACLDQPGDYDCAGGRGNGPNYVRGPIRVVGTDVYDLDNDNDGVACE